jgi:uncharacterized membrane protein
MQSKTFIILLIVIILLLSRTINSELKIVSIAQNIDNLQQEQVNKISLEELKSNFNSYRRVQKLTRNT